LRPGSLVDKIEKIVIVAALLPAAEVAVAVRRDQTGEQEMLGGA
jgi:hypothetical protein